MKTILEIIKTLLVGTLSCFLVVAGVTLFIKLFNDSNNLLILAWVVLIYFVGWVVREGIING